MDTPWGTPFLSANSTGAQFRSQATRILGLSSSHSRSSRVRPILLWASVGNGNHLDRIRFFSLKETDARVLFIMAVSSGQSLRMPMARDWGAWSAYPANFRLIRESLLMVCWATARFPMTASIFPLERAMTACSKVLKSTGENGARCFKNSWWELRS